MSTIGVIFDFDDTLAPDSTSGLLQHIGEQPERFWAETVNPLLEQDWDPIPAYLHKLIELSQTQRDGARITRERMREFGTTIEFFPGVEALFDSLREAAREIDSRLQVEFYLISSGLGDVLRSTRIASQFKDIWACEFHCNDDDEIVFPRKVVSFTEKTKYLYKISKGLVGPESRSRPFAVNDRTRDFRIPFAQMLFVGDGHTDVPCFALIKRYDGVPIGVYDQTRPSKWGRKYGLVRDERVRGLYSANFTPGSDLHNMLIMSVHDIAQRMMSGALSR